MHHIDTMQKGYTRGGFVAGASNSQIASTVEDSYLGVILPGTPFRHVKRMGAKFCDHSIATQHLV
eukprot:560547-Prorocentrum_minimum.AAC.4